VKDDANCNRDTVDHMGPELARESRAFLVQLKVAVRADDKAKVASMVRYPLKFLVGQESEAIADRSNFLRDYAKIITPPVKKSLEEQSAECLFGNWQGFMIGDGEIWFTKLPKGTFRIITVNATPQ
jgi:hypothetical protein